MRPAPRHVVAVEEERVDGLPARRRLRAMIERRVDEELEGERGPPVAGQLGDDRREVSASAHAADSQPSRIDAELDCLLGYPERRRVAVVHRSRKTMLRRAPVLHGDDAAGGRSREPPAEPVSALERSEDPPAAGEVDDPGPRGGQRRAVETCRQLAGRAGYAQLLREDAVVRCGSAGHLCFLNRARLRDGQVAQRARAGREPAPAAAPPPARVRSSLSLRRVERGAQQCCIFEMCGPRDERSVATEPGAQAAPQEIPSPRDRPAQHERLGCEGAHRLGEELAEVGGELLEDVSRVRLAATCARRDLLNVGRAGAVAGTDGRAQMVCSTGAPRNGRVYSSPSPVTILPSSRYADPRPVPSVTPIAFRLARAAPAHHSPRRNAAASLRKANACGGSPSAAQSSPRRSTLRSGASLCVIADTPAS